MYMFIFSTPQIVVLVNSGEVSHRRESSLEKRLIELRHHYVIEAAVLEGAKNAIKLLTSTKSQDKKALQEVRENKEGLFCKFKCTPTFK